MTDLFNSGYLPLHMLNILIHVGSGSIAIGLGIAQLMTRKGGLAHAWIGRVYLTLYVVVIATAVIGSFAFGFRAFLAALTLSAAYWLISGLRVLVIRTRGPELFDQAASLAFIAGAGLLMIAMNAFPEQSTPAAWIALAHLTLLCLYDLARMIGGHAWLQRSWLNEHIYKMIGSHGAMISAAGGNLFLSLQPWSIVLPSSLSVAIIALFIFQHRFSKTTGVREQTD